MFSNRIHTEFVNVITRRALQEAAQKHPKARTWLDAWYTIAKAARWGQLGDVRADYPTTDQVNACLIFDVCGNNFRLIIRVSYANEWTNGSLFVKYFLTHAEYNKDHWKECCQ